MGLIFLVVWVALFVWRKSDRKEMTIMTLIFAFAGPAADILYTQDWWNPLTITNTKIGVEALFVGAMIGGVAAVTYTGIFKKEIRIREVSKTEKTRRNFDLVFILLLSVIIFFGSFYLLGLNSFFATIFALIIPTIIIWVRRRDLILNSLGTGLSLVIIASLIYSVLQFLTPGWVHAFWIFKNVPDIVILNLPVDDIVWYFLAGLFIGPLYEYWQEGKVIDA